VNNQGEPVFFTNSNGQPITWTSNALDLYIEGETRLRAADVFVGAVVWWGQFLKEGTARSQGLWSRTASPASATTSALGATTDSQ
jgi:hypothetical protein